MFLKSVLLAISRFLFQFHFYHTGSFLLSYPSYKGSFSLTLVIKKLWKLWLSNRNVNFHQNVHLKEGWKVCLLLFNYQTCKLREKEHKLLNRVKIKCFLHCFFFPSLHLLCKCNFPLSGFSFLSVWSDTSHLLLKSRDSCFYIFPFKEQILLPLESVMRFVGTFWFRLLIVSTQWHHHFPRLFSIAASFITHCLTVMYFDLDTPLSLL